MDYSSYYGRLDAVEIKPHQRWQKMQADEFIQKVLNDACERLIEENAKKWLHFERRFMGEINKLREELKEENKRYQKEQKEKDAL